MYSFRSPALKVYPNKNLIVSSQTFCFFFPNTLPKRFLHLLQGQLGKSGQNKGSLVDTAVVVPVALALLLRRQRTEGLADVVGGVLGAHHEPDLAGGVGGDGGVGILGDGEDLAAGLLELDDELEVEPLVLGCDGGS